MDTNVLQMSQPPNFGGGGRTFAIQKLLPPKFGRGQIQ